MDVSNIWCSCSNRSCGSNGSSHLDIASSPSPPRVTAFGTDTKWRRRFHRATSTNDTMSLQNTHQSRFLSYALPHSQSHQSSDGTWCHRIITPHLHVGMFPVYGFSISTNSPNRPIVVSFYPFVTALVAYDMNYFDPVFTCLFGPGSDHDRIAIRTPWLVATMMAFGHAQTPAATRWNSFNQPNRCASPASKRYSILLFLMWSIITTAFDAVMAASVGSIVHHFTW